VKFIKKAVS